MNQHVRKVDASQHSTLTATVALLPAGDRIGLPSELVPLAEVVQRSQALGPLPHLGLPEAPAARELDHLVPLSARLTESDVVRDRVAEIVHRHRGVAPETEAQAELDCLIQVVETSPIALIPGHARAGIQQRRNVFDTELSCEREALLDQDRGVGEAAGDRESLGCRAVCDYELSTRRLLLEQRYRLEAQAFAARDVAKSPHERRKLVQSLRDGTLVQGTERLDRLFMELDRLGRLSPLDEDPRELSASGRERVLVGAGERDGTPVVRLSHGRVQVRCALSREQQNANELAGDVRPLVARRPYQLQRLRVVVDEDLRMVGDALRSGLLDPAGGGEMLLGARRARNLLVGDIADERVPEGELLLAVDRGNPDRADELAVHEPVQVPPDRISLTLADRGDAARPEHPADDGGVMEERLELGPEGVEPCGDERMHGLGHGETVDGSSLREHACELLGVERVATRPLEEHPLRLGRQERAVEESVDEATGLLDRERRERDRRRVALASTPARLPLEELGSRRAEEEERHGNAPVEEVLDELEERTVGPVEILDDEHARPAGCHASRNRRHAVKASSRLTAAASSPTPTSGASREPNHARSRFLERKGRRASCRASLLLRSGRPTRGFPPRP